MEKNVHQAWDILLSNYGEKYYTISLSGVYTIKINPHTRESRFNHTECQILLNITYYEPIMVLYNSYSKYCLN